MIQDYNSMITPTAKNETTKENSEAALVSDDSPEVKHET